MAINLVDIEPEDAAAQLAHAPIILVGSRRKIGLIAIFSLGFVIVGLWEMRQQGTWYGVPVPYVGGMGLILGLLGGAVATVQLFRPPTLTFTTESLTFQTFNRSLSLSWSEVERFHLWRPATARLSMVGYTRRGAARTKAESFSRGLGCDGAFPDQFLISTPALLALCEACRMRWG